MRPSAQREAWRGEPPSDRWAGRWGFHTPTPPWGTFAKRKQVLGDRHWQGGNAASPACIRACLLYKAPSFPHLPFHGDASRDLCAERRAQGL